MKQETIEYLKNFKILLDEGIISREEYEAKKSELLSRDDQDRNIKNSPGLTEPSGQPIIPAQGQNNSSKTSSDTVDIILIIVGLIFSLIGVLGFIMNGPKVTFGADYAAYSYEVASHTVQAIYVVVMAIGSIEICLGTKGYLEKKNSLKTSTTATN